MDKQREYILQRLSKPHFDTLWKFYRRYFFDDSSCLQFIFDAVKNEPPNDGSAYNEMAETPGCYINANGVVIKENVFYPRRMLNAVERFVSVARDMEQIREGKDVFKIVFIISCVETLQNLGNSSLASKSKVQTLLDFFGNYTSDSDKQYIRTHFRHDDDDPFDPEEDSFKQFIGVLNEYRNCAAHEGDYWDYCFNNNSDGSSVPLVLHIDLNNFSKNQKKEHCFITNVSYADFEAIFVRTCISFIKKYISSSQDEA